jgi:hypothetical protein
LLAAVVNMKILTIKKNSIYISKQTIVINFIYDQTLK